MPPRIPLGRLLLVLCSTTVGGCSFAFVHGPPPNHKTAAFFDCTAGNVLPILDTVFAASVLLDAVGAGTASGTSSGSTSSRTSDAIVLGAGAALLAASAGYGFKRTSECRDAEADLVRRTPLAPAFAGAPRLLAPPVRYDPWVAHPAVAPVTPVAEPALPPVPAAPLTSPGAPAPAPASPWDEPAPAK